MAGRLPPAVLVCGAWVLAVALAIVVLPGRPPVGAVAAGLAVPCGALAVFVRPLRLPLMAVAALLGVARVELAGPSPSFAAAARSLAGAQVQLRGTVADDPRDLASGYELLVQPLAAVRSDGVRLPAFGDVLVQAKGVRRAGYGDVVELAGRLRLPADLPGFDRRAYLAARGAWLELPAAAVDVVRAAAGPPHLAAGLRDLYRSALASVLPAPDAAVMEGIVLGIRSGIPPRLQQALIATGLVHLLVLSGLKVAIFARLVTGALGAAMGRAAIWPALGLVALYAAAGGATPAAVRAAAMGGLALFGGRFGRPAHVWTSLAVTAALMTAWEPDLAWNVGFQLSFVGTAAIVLLTPPIAARLRRIPPVFREPLAVTAAAQVGTAPLSAADFHVLSLSAPLANALVLPLLPALVGGGLLLAPLAAVPAVGHLAALPLAALTRYVGQVAVVLAGVPGGAVAVPSLPPAAGAAYYLGLAGAVLALGGTALGRHRRAGVAIGVLGPLLVAGGELAAWSLPAAQATVLAVGDGQALLLRGPGGSVLIDGGPSPARLRDELALVLPPWQSDLAGLVVTAPGAGRTAGLAGLGRHAGWVAAPAAGLPGTAWRRDVAEAVASGAAYLPLTAGEHVRRGGFAFEVLSPEPGEPGDEAGWGDLALRVTGPSGRSLCDFSDLATDAQRLAASHLGGGCDYLVFTARAAPDPDLLAWLDPAQLVLSAGAGTRTPPGLPPGRLQRTDQEGDVVLAL